MRVPRSTVVLTLGSLGVATVLGLIASANHFEMMIDERSPMPWRHAAVMEMPFWYAAAVLTPALVWALHRFPDRSRGMIRAAQHGAIALTWIVVETVLETAARHALGTGLSGPAPSYVQMVLESLIHGILAKLLIYGAIVGVIYALTYYTRYRERDLAASQLEARLAEAQLRMLRMQLNPHFLFNAMNTVAMLTRAGRSSESVAMLLELSTLMRDALRGDAPDSGPLEDELNLLNRYVSVEQVRFGGKLAFDVDVPVPLRDATVPSFLLQPLLENAIRHGRANSDGVASMGVRAECTDDRLILSVWDDGTGLTIPANDSQGVGLRNVRDRLCQLYGTAQSFEIGRTDEGTVARISIPIQFATTAS
ncbi:MAG: sensor histidine kinase [Gemmatimonadaceae bacterium]